MEGKIGEEEKRGKGTVVNTRQRMQSCKYKREHAQNA
jgi:hypothetical protein